LHSCTSPILNKKVSDDDTSTEVRQEWTSAQDPPGWLMTPWTFSIKFPYDTLFIFGSLMFAAGDDGSHELLTRGPAPRHLTPVYGQATYLSANPSTSGGVCSGLNSYAKPYYLFAMTSQGRPIGKTILQSSIGALSSSSSGAIHDRDPIKYYPRIGGSTCWNPAIEAHRINMVGPARGNSGNSSSKYPTIGGSETSDARTPSSNTVQNLNLDFNTVRL
jgi:hypothetical protein